ncbi:Na(+)/H(+) antiporter subunit C [Streptomyces sp. NPDC016845]|uniref:Na(+)/H(+) antiporter subunit C n=1 Tax=Streptomyces sp. NPDC016845 TaxID=3364972 RepID=UPI0037A99343
MTVSLSLLVCAVVLTTVGCILIHTRSLTRVLVGVIVCGNGVNLFVLTTTGRAGVPPLLYPGVAHARVTDPLPQAIALTAVVITLATTAFVLAMAYRSGRLSGSDFVPDDVEDRRVVLRAEIAEERAELRERYRGEGLRAWRDERREQRHRLRLDRAYQARARDATGDLWDDILGADPQPSAESARDAAGGSAHDSARQEKEPS